MRVEDWIYMHMVYGSPSDQPFLRSGFVTQMLNPIWGLEPQQIYRLHQNEKKRQYSSRVLDIEHSSLNNG